MYGVFIMESEDVIKKKRNRKFLAKRNLKGS